LLVTLAWCFVKFHGAAALHVFNLLRMQCSSCFQLDVAAAVGLFFCTLFTGSEDVVPASRSKPRSTKAAGWSQLSSSLRYVFPKFPLTFLGRYLCEVTDHDHIPC
jgi:hypothetical protein